MTQINSVAPQFSTTRDGGEQVEIHGSELDQVTSVGFGPFEGAIVEKGRRAARRQRPRLHAWFGVEIHCDRSDGAIGGSGAIGADVFHWELNGVHERVHDVNHAKNDAVIVHDAQPPVPDRLARS